MDAQTVAFVGLAVFVALVGIVQIALVRRWQRSVQDNASEPTHKKYIGLDEYRARQQKQRYRDRVN